MNPFKVAQLNEAARLRESATALEALANLPERPDDATYFGVFQRLRLSSGMYCPFCGEAVAATDPIIIPTGSNLASMAMLTQGAGGGVFVSQVVDRPSKVGAGRVYQMTHPCSAFVPVTDAIHPVP